MTYRTNFEVIFAVAHARHPAAAMPGFVGSPMDDRTTLSIARSVIDDCEQAAGLDREMLRAAAGRVARPAQAG